jgi:glycosyltransferase involved in cell wall biosynthesis
MAYPEYEKVNAQFELAYLIKEPNIDSISEALNKLISDKEYHRRLQENALKAREIYCWQEEEKRLVQVYRQLFAEA